MPHPGDPGGTLGWSADRRAAGRISSYLCQRLLLELIPFRCQLIQGTPVAREHDALCWLSVGKSVGSRLGRCGCASRPALPVPVIYGREPKKRAGTPRRCCLFFS